jgi:hypothetical protein
VNLILIFFYFITLLSPCFFNELNDNLDILLDERMSSPDAKNLRRGEWLRLLVLKTNHNTTDIGL